MPSKDCSAIPCKTQVSPSVFMCDYHWAMVPTREKRLYYRTAPDTKEYYRIAGTIKLNLWAKEKKEPIKTY